MTVAILSMATAVWADGRVVVVLPQSQVFLDTVTAEAASMPGVEVTVATYREALDAIAVDTPIVFVVSTVEERLLMEALLDMRGAEFVGSVPATVLCTACRSPDEICSCLRRFWS